MLKPLSIATVASTALLCLSAAFVECTSSLDVSSEMDPSGAFRLVTVEVTGSLPTAPVLLAVGTTEGETVLENRLGSLTIGLDRPFGLSLLGVTDTDGSLTRVISIPNDLAMRIDAFAQAIGLSVSVDAGPPQLSTCPSNVASVSF